MHHYCLRCFKFYLHLMRLGNNNNENMHGKNVWQLDIIVMFGQRPPITPNKSMSLSLIAIFVPISFGFPPPTQRPIVKYTSVSRNSILRLLISSNDIKEHEVFELVQNNALEPTSLLHKNLIIKGGIHKISRQDAR